MRFTNEQIEKLIALGRQIAAIADAVPALPADTDWIVWGSVLRPSIEANETLLTDMLALLQNAANPSPDTLAQIAQETAVAPESQKPSIANRWAATFPA